jgi:hypothetical protein
MNLRLSDPAFYAEITSGSLESIPVKEAGAEDIAFEAAANKDEGSTDATVPERCATLFNATVASDLTSIDSTNDGNNTDDSGDEYKAPKVFDPDTNTLSLTWTNLGTQDPGPETLQSRVSYTGDPGPTLLDDCYSTL